MCCIPFTGEPVEVWIANYVLMGYGEGAVMGVPAHDERDFEFATRSGIPIRTVVKSATGAYETVVAPWQDAYGEHGITVNSGEFSGLDYPGGGGRDRRGARGARHRCAGACSSGCATGAFRASATGAARFR